MQLIFSPPNAILTAVPCPVDVGASLAWFERDTLWSRFRTPLWKSSLASTKPDFDTDHSVVGVGTQNHAKTIDNFLGRGNLGLSTLGGSSADSSDTESKWRPQVQSHISALFGQVLFPSGAARAFRESQGHEDGSGASGQSSTQSPTPGCNHEHTLERQLNKHVEVSLFKVNVERSCADMKNSNTTTVHSFLRTQMVYSLRLFLNSFNTTSMTRIHVYRLKGLPLPSESVWISIGPL